MGRPGVAREYKKLLAAAKMEISPFYDDFPSLEKYALAYDWSNPRVDMSLKGA